MSRARSLPTSMPTWLEPSDVSAWLKLPAGQDDGLIASCVLAAEVEVERARYDLVVITVTADETTYTYAPTDDVYQAAVMLAARIYRRRNSPGGIELFAESVAYVARYDPDIQRALRQGAWAWPGVG